MKLKSFLFIVLFVVFCTPVFALDAVTSFSGGSILQDSKGEFMFSVGLDIPVVTKKSAGYTLITKAEVIYSDYQYEAVNEIQGIKTLAINQKKLGTLPLHIGLGAGFWTLHNAAGEDIELGIFSLSFGTEFWGMQFDAGVEVAPLKYEKDIYYPYLSISIISL